MEFENLSRTSQTLLKGKTKKTSVTRLGVVYSNLLELDEKFDVFSKEILDLEKSGVSIEPLVLHLEEISKIIKESKLKLKQGGRKNA